ncbi:MAG: tRNA pseudouridine synthase [Pseudomonadota bacterium]|jgi:tRNA pseudouridine13 synthase
MSPDLAPRPLPLITRDLPGTGGLTKISPEDFVVEELPAYEPCGVGDHLYLWVEKRGLSTAEALRQIAQAFGVSEREMGCAGQKDRQALTRQWMSVLTKRDEAVVDDDRIRVLDRRRHGNKLRLGHLRGNRFTVTLRGVREEATERAQAVLDRLRVTGLPNFYGTQRFGRFGDNAALGAALLGLGDHRELGRAKRERFMRKMALSALQSELFNRCLAERMQDGLLDIALDGDVLRKRETGGHFTCEAPEVDAARVRSGELDVTGPMPGPKERPAARGEALVREERVLAEAGLSRELFAKGGADAEGARRPYRVVVESPSVRRIGDDAIELSFALPSGSYATRLLAEVTKADVALPGEG